MTFEQLILHQRPHIDQLVRRLARRYYLAAGETDDFRAKVDRALERNDYELLRAFDGRSTWETYLTTIVMRQFFLFQAELWGQWRPSLTAQRLGPEAMLLEELVVRDSLPIPAAFDVMRARHRVDLPQSRLEQMAGQLRLATGDAPPAPPLPGEIRGRNVRLELALREAVASAPPDDRLLLALRFRDGQTPMQMARVLKVDARPLQRRIEQLLDGIRGVLLQQGLDVDDVAALLEHPGADSAPEQHRWWNSVLARPSN